MQDICSSKELRCTVTTNGSMYRVDTLTFTYYIIYNIKCKFTSYMELNWIISVEFTMTVFNMQREVSTAH